MYKDNFFGCVYGLAIGDALGHPNEFENRSTNLDRRNGKELTDLEPVLDWTIMTTKRINRKYVAIPHEEFPAGTYTDDTQMTLAIAKALLKSDLQNYKLEEIMKNISEEFIRWSDDPETNRAPGKACLYACHKLKKGTNWKESGKPDAKGSGTAMRSAPIGLIFYDKLDRLVEVASAASKCTHLHPTAGSAGIATAYLTALALQGIDHTKWISKILNASFFNEEFKNKISQVNEIQAGKNPYEALSKIGEGWMGHEAVAIALYCVLKNPYDYEKTVLTAANAEGDTDTITCIAGAISGAYNGIDKLPQKWVEKVEKTEYLGEIANKLYCKINR